jgi:prolyl oligopeptidase
MWTCYSLRGMRFVPALMLGVAVTGLSPLRAWNRSGLDYPPARRSDVAIEAHGVKVPDPYRWMEELDSDETRAWLKAQDELSQSYLRGLAARDAVADDLLAAMDYERTSPPIQRAKRYFFIRNSGLQDQPVLYRAEALTDESKQLIDFQQESQDGRLGFAGLSVSPHGKYVAYGLSLGGSDWVEWRVRDVDSGRDLPDRLEWTKYYAPAWSADEQALYYSRFPRPAESELLTARDLRCTVYRHRLGAAATEDAVVFERPDHPTWQFEPQTTEDGRWLVITIGDGQVGDRGVEEIHVVDLQARAAKPLALVEGFDAEYLYVSSEGPLVYLRTTDDAPNGRVIAVDIRDPRRAAWKTILPASSPWQNCPTG